MRTASAALLAHLGGDVLTTCYLVRLTRRDGVRFGFAFTSQVLTYLGVTYVPQGSLSATALHQTGDAGVDNLDVMGALSSDRITDTELRAGLYDGAEVLILLVNYADLSMGHMTLMRGHIGDVSIGASGQYGATVTSLQNQMTQQIGDMTSPTCRCRRLGDAQCKVNMANYTASGFVSPGGGDPRALSTGIGGAAGLYAGGVLRVTAGPNAGVERDIKTFTGGAVILQEPFPFPFTAGTAVQMEQGCDRRFPTCRDKFNNAINFHGENALPGTDALTRYGRPPA